MSKDDKLSNDFLEMLSDEELYLLIDMLPYKPFFELIKNNPKEFKNETMGCTMNISSNMLKKRVPDILFNRIKRHDIPITNTVTRNTNTIISIVNKHIFKETSDEYFLEKTIESNDINNFIKLIDIILDVLKPEYIKLFLKLIGKELSDEQNDYIDTGMEITVMKKEIEHKVRKELEEEYRDQISEIEKIHRTEIANQVEKTKEIKEKLIAIEAELSDKKEHLNLLNNEIEKIKTEKSDEINKLQNHINKLNYKLNELEAERVGLKHSIQDKDSLIESLKNDLNMKNDEYIIAEKKWNSQNERLLNEQKSLEIKCKDLVQAKIMLDSSIKELETEKAQLEDKLSGYKNPTQTQSIKNITTNLYIKRNKIEDSPRNCNNINDFAENIATNLESTGIKDIDNVVANYIIGILAANMSPLICGYKAREIAAAISISYSGETPYIISLPNGYTNSKELLEIFNLAETNVVLIEDAVGTMNENALMPLLREKSEKGFSKKLLLLSTENLDSVKYMPTNLLNHVALVKINKYRANKKTGFEISDSREVLEQFIVLNSFKYESRIIKRLLHGLNFDSPYEMLRAIIVAYSSKLSNSKADLRGYLRSELMFICKCNNTVDVLEENIQKYQLDKNLMKIIRGGSK